MCSKNGVPTENQINPVCTSEPLTRLANVISPHQMGVPLAEACARGKVSVGNGAMEAQTNKDKQLTRHEPAHNSWNSHAARILHARNTGSSRLDRFALLQKEPAESVDKQLVAAIASLSLSAAEIPVMYLDDQKSPQEETRVVYSADDTQVSITKTTSQAPPLIWDWELEHEDRKKERKADAALHGATPFEVDRKLLKDVVREKIGVDVGRIQFLSSGTFHKAYLITTVNHIAVVARVARRFMPRLKTESEVATIHYLRHKTNVPVSTIYHYDSNPYNRLGGEFILMSKAPGIPLAQVYHGLCYNDLVKLLKNLAAIMIPLFAHRFPAIGSLYLGPDPRAAVTSGSPTPKAAPDRYSAFPFAPTLEIANFLNGTTPRPSTTSLPTLKSVAREYHVGPIISWPFFGSNRGELVHPAEINRGPWPTTDSYLASCVTREVDGVIRENEGKSAPHRLHLDPAEIHSSRHHSVRAVPGDESDDSDEWNLSESEDEWEGPGDAMYRDYRRMQRTTFLIAHLSQRVETVKKEMSRWMQLMEKLMDMLKKEDGPEEFSLDCHDLSLENIFVDEEDHTKITCIIDWESTTTRPLWACAHVPAFLQSSPFLTKLFREVVSQLPNDPSISVQLPKTTAVSGKPVDLKTLCDQWLYYEANGARLRLAHRFVEWDGWEEGLIDTILGPEEYENEWFKATPTCPAGVPECHADSGSSKGLLSSPGPRGKALQALVGSSAIGSGSLGRGMKISSKLPILQEQQKEQTLDTTGDICGGRGGELGRRLEAWLHTSGNADDDQEAGYANGASCINPKGPLDSEKAAVDVEAG